MQYIFLSLVDCTEQTNRNLEKSSEKSKRTANSHIKMNKILGIFWLSAQKRKEGKENLNNFDFKESPFQGL